MKPIIGVTCNFRDSSLGVVGVTGVVGQDFFVSADDYIRLIKQAGGIPIILPMSNDREIIEKYVSVCDGILIAGGNDIRPQEYGEEDQGCGTTVAERDLFDIQLTRLMLTTTNKPLFGICRGCQVFNVAMGGNLYQDLETAGYEMHTFPTVPRNQVMHTVNIAPGSRLHEILGTDSLGVNSYHHQAIRRLAQNAVCAARSSDGVLESIEFPGERFFLGVQWHPEMMYDSVYSQKLFQAFVSAAEKR